MRRLAPLISGHFRTQNTGEARRIRQSFKFLIPALFRVPFATTNSWSRQKCNAYRESTSRSRIAVLQHNRSSLRCLHSKNSQMGRYWLFLEVAQLTGSGTCEGGALAMQAVTAPKNAYNQSISRDKRASRNGKAKQTVQQEAAVQQLQKVVPAPNQQCQTLSNCGTDLLLVKTKLML